MSFRKSVSEFQISNRKLVKYLKTSEKSLFKQILSSFGRH